MADYIRPTILEEFLLSGFPRSGHSSPRELERAAVAGAERSSFVRREFAALFPCLLCACGVGRCRAKRGVLGAGNSRVFPRCRGSYFRHKEIKGVNEMSAWQTSNRFTSRLGRLSPCFSLSFVERVRVQKHFSKDQVSSKNIIPRKESHLETMDPPPRSFMRGCSRAKSDPEPRAAP
jgi:hypothetical protein